MATQALLIPWLIAVLSNSPPAKPPDHVTRELEGWTVRIDSRLLEGEAKPVGEHAIRLLSNRLHEIAFILPADRVARLRQVTIQLDLSHGELVTPQYHPSAEWLAEHGYSRSLARCVHIPDAREWSSRRHQTVQPWSTLHELAHAYHDQVLGFDHPEIVAAWERFRADPRTEQVRHIDGGLESHYGRTDPMEYFAEMTETLFGTNDFSPFNRGELTADRPEDLVLMRKVWGVD